MKKSILCGLLTAMVMLLTSCNKDDNNDGAPFVRISPSTDAIAFSANASESYEYEIETNQPVWLATSDQDWCVVTMDAYNNKFTVTALPNGASTPPPAATITVSAGSENTLTITATQAAMTDYEVYVCGSYETENADYFSCYWKDGVRTSLPIREGKTYNLCTSMTVSGGSIYIAGESGSPCYWKDNTLFDLDEPESDYAIVTSIAVDGDKVYVGAYNNYWIGKTVKKYPAGFTGRAIAASGGSVYYAGVLEMNNGSIGTFLKKAYQWLGTGNGGATALDTPQAKNNSEATCAFISNGTNYAGGYYVDGDTSIPCYWKNGTYNALDIPQGMTENTVGGIYVVGETVYVAGTCANNDTNIACYWQNNTRKELELPSGAYNVKVTGITVAGDKVCVSGYYQDAETNRPTACYWLNGTRTDLPKGTKESTYTAGIALIVK